MVSGVNLPAPLLPVAGAAVVRKQDGRPGRIVKVLQPDAAGPPVLTVRWIDRRGDGPAEQRVPLDALESGLRPGMDVEEVPLSATRSSLGLGVVVVTRTLGGREQALVEFPESGLRTWVPWQRLRQLRGVYLRLRNPRPSGTEQAERFRLRCLAYALQFWNENTGALSHLDIDPLPHQVHAVHRILASGNLNWMLADDVGLGKTIEVGMLLAALQRRGGYRRILIVTPPGLCRQWQEELRDKFSMDDYRVHGVDFTVNEVRHWKLYDHVIASVDRLKGEAHMPELLAGDDWDLVIFDEAHRLSRRQWGQRLDASDRFRLAAALRRKTAAMLLLTATPHQGMHDKFQALLELIRPELRREIQDLALNPEILRDMVVRNHKADVTDADGAFIFKGKVTHAIEVQPARDTREFDRALQQYLRRGYAAGHARGRQGIAIGFVMTVYRKLAASSAAAILAALERRKQRLQGELAAISDDEVEDERFAGEWEERQGGDAREFFAGELALLDELIQRARGLAADDRKVHSFMDGLVGAVLQGNPLERLLIFTEYRATQECLARELSNRFGVERVSLIHGGQTAAERRQAIAVFETDGQFLVSTEAGGEGINLQRRCHVMVNFDLPWNPMRLVQRIGRLYRYGQLRTVVVFNVHAPHTLDAQVMQLMYQRINAVVIDMAVLGGEFNEGLAEDILGQLAGLLDVDDILERAFDAGIQHTEESITAAVQRAREAVQLQAELFRHANSYDPGAHRSELVMTPGHLRSFVDGMFDALDVEVVEAHRGTALLRVRLPERLAGEIGLRGSQLWVTADRDLAARRRDAHLLDLDSPLLQHLLRRARDHHFGGLACGAQRLPAPAVIASVLRWQDAQGRRMRQELALATVSADGTSMLNGEAILDWLARPADGHGDAPSPETGAAQLAAAQAATDQRLAAISSIDLHPEGRQWVAGAWAPN